MQYIYIFKLVDIEYLAHWQGVNLNNISNGERRVQKIKGKNKWLKNG